MRVTDIYLHGASTFLPEPVEVSHAMVEGWYDPKTAQRSGLLSVAVAGNLPAPDMTVAAANETLEKSGHAPSDINVLLHAGVHYQGPDSWSVQHYILRNTLGTAIPALEVRAGCNGMLAALELAACQLAADPRRTAVLVTGGDNFSTPIVDRWRTSGNFVLGDGAASVLVSRRRGFAQLLAASSMSDPELEPLDRGGEELFPPGITVGRQLDIKARHAYWQQEWVKGNLPPIGDVGELVRNTAKQAVADAGIEMSDIAYLTHPGFNLPVLRELFFEPLGIDELRTSWEFHRRVGHAGTIDQLAGLRYLWTSRRVRAGDYVLLAGVVPGAQADCAVVQVLATYE